MKKLVIAILFFLLFAAMGFGIFSIYQTEQWGDFVKIFGTLAFGFVVLVVFIGAIVGYDVWKEE